MMLFSFRHNENKLISLTFSVDVYLLIYTLPDYARISWFFCFVTF